MEPHPACEARSERTVKLRPGPATLRGGFPPPCFQERNGIIEQTDDKESEEEKETNDVENNKSRDQDSNIAQKEFKSADTKTTVTIIEDFNISDILENVSKKPRIDDEVTVITS